YAGPFCSDCSVHHAACGRGSGAADGPAFARPADRHAADAGGAHGAWPGAVRPARYLSSHAQAPDAAVHSACRGHHAVLRAAGARMDSVPAGVHRRGGAHPHRDGLDLPLDAQARRAAPAMNGSFLQLWAHLADTPLFWLGFTLLAYLVAVIVYQR